MAESAAATLSQLVDGDVGGLIEFCESFELDLSHQGLDANASMAIYKVRGEEPCTQKTKAARTRKHAQPMHVASAAGSHGGVPDRRAAR